MHRVNKYIARRLALATIALLLIALCGRGCTSSTNPSTSDATATDASTTQPSTEPAGPPQTTFASPDDAVAALVAAVRANDIPKLEEIFGAGGDDILNSGDQVADNETRHNFLEKYDEKHQLITNDDGSVTLAIGDNDWPMPIPLVKDDDGKSWLFDTDAGKNEIINRRVGNNELNVIEVCKAICDAEKEYARRDPDRDGVPEYARKFISDPGRKNGLYWDTAEGEAASPLGIFAAAAEQEGYSTNNPTGEPRPYHGYYYRIITAQGKDAPGGAQDYVINGRLLGGFAVVAWPADYGNSGIMTFIANYTGDVYQKDLGDDTDKLARAMTEYNPDSTWTKQD
jgi:hypothetical protein